MKKTFTNSIVALLTLLAVINRHFQRVHDKKHEYYPGIKRRSIDETEVSALGRFVQIR